jgi:hypothetical protein
MSSEHVAPFFGNKKDENPENFLRSFYRRMGAASTDDAKKQQFPNFLEADSVADEWFAGLIDGDKKDWKSIEAAFRKRWPRKKMAKKTTEEFEKEILDFHLRMENLGKKETVGGKEVHAHIAWADDMEDIVRGAQLETTTNYISLVRKELPMLLREKVGTGHADWTAFLQAVRDVDLDHIRDGVDSWKKEEEVKKKEQEARKKELEEQEVLRRRVQQLERATNSPTAPLRQQMMSFGIGNTLPITTQPLQQTAQLPSNPFAGNSGGRGNLFYATQTRPPSQTNNPRPLATLADRAALEVCLQKFPHHPDTEAGRQAHQAQQAEWARTHGMNAFVTESTPYPLRPGTLPIGSGECFTCGFTGHMGRRDGSTCGGNCALHPHEQAWRAICSRILRQTRNVANIQFLAADDYGSTWQDVQGNGEGPSN